MIHPLAIVDPNAQVADDVEVGPWTIVGPDVVIGSGCVIASHVVLKGPTVIGKNNKIFQFSSVGEDTSDLKYNGEPTRLVMGDNNIVREGVTIHRGTVQDASETTIGNDNLFMAYAHVGHDSVIGNNTIFINNASLAGHVHVGDWAILAGYTLVHQFCRVGAHSFTGFGSHITKDVPAYVTVNGQPAEAKTINVEGLRRRGFSSDSITAIRRAYKIIYRQGLTAEEALGKLRVLVVDHPEIALLIESLETSTRGIIR
ncbi:MAG: acyl-ACP--UDP-N-acetylglucosamine O-acyltransferase [Oceanicoccus sp.]